MTDAVERELSALMTARRLTLAVAESCTAGLVGHRIASVDGCSAYFLGGVIAYCNAVKIRELEVSPRTLERDGAVSAATASEMASGVQRRFGAAATVAVTGIAGPGGGTETKPVGLVYIAARCGSRERVEQFRFSGDRAAVQRASAEQALALLCQAVAAD